MRRERRKHFRVEWNSPATIYDGQLPGCCIVSYFSNGGAKIVGVKATTIADERVGFCWPLQAKSDVATARQFGSDQS
jgi:hypothetical protein